MGYLSYHNSKHFIYERPSVVTTEQQKMKIKKILNQETGFGISTVQRS